MADPWVNWSWLKVGPFLANEEDRVAADRRMAEIKSEEGRQGAANRRDKEGIMSLPRQKPAGYGVPVNQSPEFTKTFQDGPPVPPAVGPSEQPIPYPDAANDWTLPQGLGAAFSQDGRNAWERARANQSAIDARPQLEATKDAGMDPFITPPTQQAAIPTEQPTTPDGVASPANLTPEQQMIEDIKRQRALVDQIYPSPPDNSGNYAAVDDYALQERDRANAMAQLAFFSGVTQGAGGSWEGVGRGLAGAGKAYSEGFERYQKALSNRATRQTDASNASYQNNVARSDAALKLYDAEQKQKKELLSEARLSVKERRDGIDDYFKKRLDLAKGNDFTPTDQGAVERIMRDWRISRDRGELIENEDVRDPAAPSS